MNDDLVEKVARAIYDSPDSQSGDTVGTVIWNSEHLFYETVEGEEIVDTARRVCMPVCRDAARAAISAVEVATPPVTGEVGELVEELAYAVWMVGNIDNDEDKARWWDDFQGLWERAATIVAKAHGRGVNCTEGFDAFRATLSNTEQPS